MSNNRESLQSAVNDIALIRQTMERAGAHLDKLSSMLILYGIGHPIIVAISWVIMLITIKTGEYQTGVRLSVMFNRVSKIFYLVLLIFFIKKRGEIKKRDGGYPLRLFELWGVILIIVPMAINIIDFLIYRVVPGFDPSSSAALLSNIVAHTMHCTMLTVALMFTGLMLGRKWLIWTGAGTLIVYPLLFVFGGGIPRDMAIVSSYYTSRGTLVNFIIPLICLAAGIYFRRIAICTEEESV